MPYSESSKINIFLSYASEDQTIADAIADMIRKGFYDKFAITMMSEFPAGINWRSKIDDSIVDTDIMIALATGRLKPEHSFTGYEIGSFMMSKRIKQYMRVGSNLPRRMIPFATLDKTPSTVNDFQGIDINPESLHTVRFDPSDTVAEIGNLSTDGSDTATKAVVKLLNDIQDLVNDAFPGSATTYSESQNRVDFFNTLARELCEQLFADISNREMAVSIPKSKLIIRVQPATQSSEDILETATVQTQGPCLDSFGLLQENRTFDWKGFLKLATAEGVAYSWNEAFRSLLVLSGTSEFVENNTILSFDGKKGFRIFIARVTTLFSGVREYQIYVIPLLRPKDYGDPQTTALFRALQVSLGYRFMFLEPTSSFSPSLMRATQLADFQFTVSTMQNALNMLLLAADDGGLNHPGMVVSLLGVDGIEQVYASWDAEKKKLDDAVGKVLAGSPDEAIKNGFIDVLNSFCEHTRELNKKYTASVMNKLQSYISSAG
jgi:hypothetical protein